MLFTRGRRTWCCRHRALVKRNYGKMPIAQLAALVGHSITAVRQTAWKMGIKLHPHLPRRVYDDVRQAHAEGLTDADIARRLGINRRTTQDIRRRLGLSISRGAILEAQRRGIISQRRTLGLRGGGNLRGWAHRRFARERGWPEGLRPRAVQILEVLAVAGPLNRWQIAEKINWNWQRSVRDKVHGQRHLLSSNDPEGSYLANLLKRGLVVYQRVQRKSGRRGIGRQPGLYMLSPAALDVIIGRVQPCGKTGS